MSPRSATLAGLCIMLLLTSRAEAVDPDTASMNKRFVAMKKALEAKDESLFKAQWHAEGYKQNLVGGSGLAGSAVYRQGSRKGWFLKPDLENMFSLPGRMAGPWIIKCEVWSVKKGGAVDRVWMLMAGGKLLGGGEKRKQVEALGARWVAKKPLAPLDKKAKPAKPRK